MSTKRIYKFTCPLFALDDFITLEMPQGAVALSVGRQDDNLCVWALVDPEAPISKRRFRVAGTGHPISEVGVFLGTVIFEAQCLVFHVFDIDVFDMLARLENP